MGDGDDGGVSGIGAKEGTAGGDGECGKAATGASKAVTEADDLRRREELLLAYR